MPADRGDPVLEVLLQPFDNGALAWPSQGEVLFLRAREGEPLRRIADAEPAREQMLRGRIVCMQTFAPEAVRLHRAGWRVSGPERLGEFAAGHTDKADETGDTRARARYSLVLVLPPRQREEARALLACAVAQCAPGGTIVACMANEEGAKSGESDVRALAGLDGTLSKQHCRVYWTTLAPERIDADLLAAWSVLDAPRRIPDDRFPGGTFLSRPGVFAWDRIDAASALLAAHLPDDLHGRAADLGAGYGYLSAELLRRCKGIVALDLYEAEARALSLARRNLSPFASGRVLGFHWHDIASGLPQAYDVIVSNPPFHAQGRADRPDIGRAFIAAAADALNPGGRLWLVANRHLPYEQTLQTRFARVRTVAQQAGFKVIESVKATKSATKSATKPAKDTDGRRA
jgi:16S rRNA (guanine1207-N2)-methyltransferase